MVSTTKRRGNAPSVSNGASDTLSNKDAVALGEVAGSASVALLAVLAAVAGLLVLHGVDGTHTTVGLDELTLAGHEGGTGGLGGTGQETAHHDGGGTKGETLDDVADVLDTTVGDAGNAEASGEAADGVDGSSLGPADGHDLLGNAGRARAHTDTEAVNTSLNEGSGLLAGNDVSANDVDAGELVLDPLDHINLVHGVTLGGVEDDDVEAGIDEEAETLLVLGTSANGGTTEELLAVGQLGGQGEVLVLVQVGAGDHGDEVEVLVDDGQLALLRLGEDLVGLDKVDTGGGGDQVSDHDVGDGLVGVLLELDVTVGDDAEQLGAKLAVLCSR